MVLKLKVATTCSPCSPLSLNSSKLNPLCYKDSHYLRELCILTLSEEITIPRLIPQPIIYYRFDVSTFMVLLPDEWVGGAWKAFKQMMLFLPLNKGYFTSPVAFRSYIHFYCFRLLPAPSGLRVLKPFLRIHSIRWTGFNNTITEIEKST
jgi:hypothetical protein